MINTAGFSTAISVAFVNVSGQIGALTKSGNGTLTLSASNSYTGGTTVNGGELTVTNGFGLGNNSGLTLTSGTFAYQPAIAGPLNLGSGAVNLSGGTVVGTALGGSAISSTAAATVTGPVTVNIYGVPNGAVSAGANNLITAASGLGTTGTYALGSVLLYDPTNYTIGSGGLAATGTAVTITPTAATALNAEYWEGGFAGYANVAAISDGNANSNWSSTDPSQGSQPPLR